jgi:alcohol dehydrogenase
MYHIPTKIHFGNKALNELEEIVNKKNPHQILLITGKNFVKKSGLQDRVLDLLKNFHVIVYDKVNPVPKEKEIYNSIEYVKQYDPDLIIGIGGGSVLDTSKIVAIMLRNYGELDYINSIKKNDKVSLIAIPTTAGTGSEVTPFSAFYKDNKKQSFGKINDYSNYPEYAIVDPELTFTMPKKLTASTGLDALSQAIESYWNINSNPLSDTHAIEAIKLTLENLENSYERVNDVDSKFNMAKASLEAGLAFSQTATTAPHSISYPMTSYFNLDHGFACALTLSEFLLYNYGVNNENCLDPRGHEFVKKRLDNLSFYLGFDSVNELYSKIKEVMKNINAPLSLNEANIDDIDIILREGFTKERMSNNPRKVSEESLNELLEKIR